MNFRIFLNQTFENSTILRHIYFPLNFSIQENRELDGAKSRPIPSYDVKAGNATHHPNLPPFIPQSIYRTSRKISTKKCDFILKYIEQSKQREKRCASVYFWYFFFLEGVNLPYAQTFQGMPSHFGLFVLNVQAIYHLNGLLCSLLSYIYLLT